VEDRVTDGLYLEMTELAPADYAAKRVPEVLAQPGVTLATWWRNDCRDRRDLPRRLPEFETLGVFEVDASFRRPTAPPELLNAYHFRRTPRPGQGTLSGKPTLGLELVLISPKHPEAAQALRDWADFIHLRWIAAANVPGFTMITPYENAGTGSPRFMHFYEMDTPDAEKHFAIMEPTTRRLVGEPGTATWKEWANHPELSIDYVNTFTRLGERKRSSRAQ
jgi:hypothetical protein